jgi:predicted alpha/beta-hydrolase family hydrolase
VRPPDARPLSVGDGLSGAYLEAAEPRAVLVLAHGAGAGFQHATMRALAEAFAAVGLSTLRFNFPFMEAGRRRVDAMPVAVASLREAFAAAAGLAGGLPVYLGGHSFGGRMASHAALEDSAGVAGLIFCAFPLHPAGKPAVTRAAHLAELELPMLFLSGTRDALAERELLEATVAALGERAQLHWLATADHSYRILKRQRNDDVFEEMGAAAGAFLTATGAC